MTAVEISSYVGSVNLVICDTCDTLDKKILLNFNTL